MNSGNLPRDIEEHIEEFIIVADRFLKYWQINKPLGNKYIDQILNYYDIEESQIMWRDINNSLEKIRSTER